jgi:hypothetical protein
MTSVILRFSLRFPGAFCEDRRVQNAKRLPDIAPNIAKGHAFKMLLEDESSLCGPDE